MAEKPEDSRKVAGGTRGGTERERQASAAGTEEPRPKAEGLLEEVLRRENLKEALKRVRANKGAPGIDGMTVDALTPYLKEHWPRIREKLLSDAYVPQPVRRVEIPKPDGKGVRTLGIPTVLIATDCKPKIHKTVLNPTAPVARVRNVMLIDFPHQIQIPFRYRLRRVITA